MKLKLLISLLLISAAAQAQLNLDIRNHDIAYFQKQEQLLYSTPFTLNTTYVQSADIDQPLIYRRKQANMPDLLVYYFAYKKDGAIFELQYEWDSSNFEKTADSVKKPLSILEPYVARYQDLLSALTIKYGKAKSTGAISDMSLVENGSFTETDTWDLDAMSIKLTIVLSNKYLKRGMMTIKPNHRIRLYIKDKTRSTTPNKIDVIGNAISDTKVDSLNKVTQGFLADVFKSDYEHSKSYLSDKLVKIIKTEQIEKLKDLLTTEHWKVYYKGLQIAGDGNAYIILKYKKELDQSDPPAELLNVIFDAQNRILGLQPVKMQPVVK